MTTTKVCQAGGGNDNGNNYPPPELAAGAATSELDMAIPFGLGGKEAAATSAGYDELALTVFARGSIKNTTCRIWIQRTKTTGRSGGRATVRRRIRNKEVEE